MQYKSIDTTLALLVLGLVIFGTVMISSVSVYPSFKLTSGWVAKELIGEPYNHYFILRHIFYVALGILMIVIFSKIPYQYLEKYAPYIFLITLV